MSLSRRTIIKTAAVTPLFATASSWTRVLGANDRLNIAVIGTGGMGTAIFNTWSIVLIPRTSQSAVSAMSIEDGLTTQPNWPHSTSRTRLWSMNEY